MQSQNQEIYLITIIGIILGLLLVGFVVTMLFLYQRRQREMQKMKDAYEKEALRSQLEIQENTLKTIAQELHDNIGQMLSVVKLSLSVAPIDRNHEAFEPLQSSRELLNKAIFDLSNLTKSLHTERILDIGLAESIRYELHAIKKAGLVDINFQSEGSEMGFSEQKAIFLFRMFQESLNNTLKHAKASMVKVGLVYSDDKLVMSIIDDGRGFQVPDMKQPGIQSTGVGLRSLYNRASIIGAELSVNSEPGKGTAVLIELPYEAD